MYFETLDKSECSGCTACVGVCHVNAIKMIEDAEGFLYPQIDEEVCINCGLCRKICSFEHPQYHNSKEPLVLAAIINDMVERQRSTSGGIFFVISKWILEQGGIVYGAAFDTQLQLHHVAVENMQDLQKLRGSKYIQSDLGKIFLNVKEQLEKGRLCYFTGTGCQIAGLKAYLKKKYDNLITSDLVCHGTPSQHLFNLHIDYIENKYGDKILDYKFRDYKNWGGCETICFTNHKEIVNPTYELSPFLYSFMYAYTYRYSCYNCKFATVPRQGDITLADFWGSDTLFPELDHTSGVSMLLLNSNKGEEVWRAISNVCDYRVSSIKEGVLNNPNLCRPTEMPVIRKVIYNLIEKEGYKKIAKQYFRSPHENKIKFFRYLNQKTWYNYLLSLRRLFKNK